MKHLSKFLSIRLALAVVAGLAASTTSSHAQGASATISDVAGSGDFDYTITLLNTGSDNLNSFWYGWTTSGNNLPSDPTTPMNSSGWGNTLDGNSIQWINSSGTALSPGQSGTFTFVSTSTPTQITTTPDGSAVSGQSVAYVNGITFTEANPGDSTPVFSPVLVSAPEPSSVTLLMTGLIFLTGLLKWSAASSKLRPTPKIAGVKSVRP